MNKLLHEQYVIYTSAILALLKKEYDSLHSAVVIPNLSLGLSLSSPHVAPELLDSFMRRMLTSRISRRVLVEHHIALSESFRQQRGETSTGERHVGIIYTGLSVIKSIQKCINILKERAHRVGTSSVLWPDVVVDGHLDTRFSYIREHLESVKYSVRHELDTEQNLCRYIIFELMKNVSNTSPPQPHLF